MDFEHLEEVLRRMNEKDLLKRIAFVHLIPATPKNCAVPVRGVCGPY